MNVYLWEWLPGLSASHHDGGAVFVVASDIDEAEQLVADEVVGMGGAPNYWSRVTQLYRTPRIVLPLAEEEARRVTIMYDTGCC